MLRRDAEDADSVHLSLSQEQTEDFLTKLFSDERLFSDSSNASNLNIDSVLAVMDQTYQRIRGSWTYFPDLTESKHPEEELAEFLNGIIRHTPNAHLCTRKWVGKAVLEPVEHSSTSIRKVDLLLCEKEVIDSRSAWRKNAGFNIRTDVYAMGETRACFTEGENEDSYVDLAKRVAFMLEAQDGRHAAPGIQIMGSRIVLTLFDQGGSISTYPLNIHSHAQDFLRIVLGITFADRATLGFDPTITTVQNGQKSIAVSVRGAEYAVSARMLLVFSDSLHTRGTTVRCGSVVIDGKEEEVVVKDTWVDPQRRYTEGRNLKLLKEAGVKGVPNLVTEQQVRTRHPVTGQLLNHSTHTLRSLVADSPRLYRLRALTRLVSKPRRYHIYDFTSLGELLFALIDGLCTHRNAVEKAHIIHGDVSPLSLFLVADMQSDLGSIGRNFMGNELRQESLKLSRRGLLGNWGFAGPYDSSARELPPVSSSTPKIRVSGHVELLSEADLRDTHSIVVPVADEPLPSDSDTFFNTSLLPRTGTWGWMTAELSLEPDKPVVHRVHHDLESFFYVLISICLRYDNPGELKSSEELEICFNPLFSVNEPSVRKTITIQAQVGWTGLVLPFISPYFQPLIPLLEKLRRELILPLTYRDGKVQGNEHFGHGDFINAIIEMFSQLPESCCMPRGARSEDVVVQSYDSSSNTEGCDNSFSTASTEHQREVAPGPALQPSHVHSWTTWLPYAKQAPTPPSFRATPISGRESPGLFGPRSPRD